MESRGEGKRKENGRGQKTEKGGVGGRKVKREINENVRERRRKENTVKDGRGPGAAVKQKGKWTCIYSYPTPRILVNNSNKKRSLLFKATFTGRVRERAE